MDAVRVILVEPYDAGRDALERLLRGLEGIWLTEVCRSYADAPRAVDEQAPDLALVGLDSNQEAGLGLVAEILHRSPRTVVLPASIEHGGDLILRAVRAGAREFLPLPTNPPELIAAIERVVQIPASVGTGGSPTRLSGRIIALTGASGGVGCTALSVGLAASLARDPNRSVALADFDLLMGAVDASLDIVSDYTLLEVARCPDRLDLTLLKRSMTRHNCGAYVLPRPVALEDAARIDPEAVRRVFGLLKAAFGTIIVDTSKALQPSDLVAFEMADVILMVSQLDLICLRNTERLLRALGQVDGLAERIKLVFNRDGSRDEQIKASKAAEFLKMPASWTIPDAPREFAAARARGVPLLGVAPKSAAQRAVEHMARELVDTPGAGSVKTDTPPLRRIAAMF